jgi:hypothetical protein
MFDELDLTYTRADKDAESIDFIHIDTASFLKRSWQYDPDMDQYLAKLDHSSINKMLTTWTESRSISAQEQSLATIESACREYFYYGKTIYNKKLLMFNTAIDVNNLRFLMKDRNLPSWDQLRISYFENGRKEDIYKM